MQKYLLAKNRLGEVMRICTLQVVLITIASGMALAHPGYAQKVLDKELTISLRDITIENALHEIEVAANVKFIYSPERLKLNETISLKVEKKKLGDVLSDLLTPRGIEFIGDSKNDFVTLRPAKKKEAERDGKKTSSVKSNRELSPNSTDVSYATITGVVTDGSTNLPLPGVNVIVKGTTNGTNTDSDGYYSINANDNDILVFSFIGFKTQELQILGRSTLDVILADDAAKLNEVIVKAGYWDVKEKQRTGNISRITTKTITNQPISNPLLALGGRMPGVYVQQATGVPGGNVSINIRGRNSIRSEANDPLYVVDGVPFPATFINTNQFSGSMGKTSPLNSISPSDIQSIEILKDADATAVYGSRGANGVVLITTKKGESGRTAISLNVSSGVGRVSNMIDLLNTQQYVEMRKEAYANDNRIPNTINGVDLLVWDTTRHTNWQKELIGGSAHLANAQLSLSGGNANTQFLLSGNYYRESTVFPGDFKFIKGSGYLTLSHSSTDKKLQITSSVNYVLNNNLQPETDLITDAINLPPNAPALFDEDGDLNWTNWTNPLAKLKYTSQNKTDNLITNTTIGYQVLPGLQLKGNFGYTVMKMQELVKHPLSYWQPLIPDPSWGETANARHADSSIKTWIAEPQVEYRRSLLNGTLNVLIGTTFQDTKRQSIALDALGYTSDALIEDINAAPIVDVTENSLSQYRYNAIFGRINYNWNERILINLTGRRDGSSRFGPDKQFANFGAVGLAWIFSNEQFSKENLSFLSFGKLRYSYGITGSDQIPDYGYLDTYSTAPYSYQGPGVISTRLPNNDYGWESNKKMEAAIELGFFNDRVLFSTSWYQNRSSNQLVGYPLSGVTGFSSIQYYNLDATVQNTGWEFDINSTNVTNKDITWKTNFNFTIPRNKLLSYPGAGSLTFPNYVVGKSLGTLNAYHYTGVNPETGIYTNEDVNQDGSISYPDDLKALKILGQNYYGGLENTLSVHGFELNIFVQFVKQTGHNPLANGGFNMPGVFFASNSTGNQPTQVMYRWQENGDEVDVQRFSTRSSGEAYSAYLNNLSVNSDRLVVDASFIRLKNIALSWQVPLAWRQKINIDNLRIYLQAQNLFTITNYIGFDPENYSLTSLPPLRIYTFGIQLNL